MTELYSCNAFTEFMIITPKKLPQLVLVSWKLVRAVRAARKILRSAFKLITAVIKELISIRKQC